MDPRQALAAALDLSDGDAATDDVVLAFDGVGLGADLDWDAGSPFSGPAVASAKELEDLAPALEQ
ncbi:MAG TPA: hypothetical protein VMW62_03080 [Chloroflexota bacterium]|nr:hypothetical protein [Chloroflexota bacterium]